MEVTHTKTVFHYVGQRLLVDHESLIVAEKFTGEVTLYVFCKSL